MRRPDGNPAPLLVLQHAVGSFGRELCISYELDPEKLVCRHDTPVQEPLVTGDLNGSVAGVPPDEIVTARGNTAMNIFGFAPVFPLDWSASTRPVPDGMESVALGDLDRDADLDVVVGQQINSLDARVNSIHYYRLNPSGSGGLESVGTAAAHHAGRRCGGRRRRGRRRVQRRHRRRHATGRGWCTSATARSASTAAATSRSSVPNPATSTRVSMAVGDLSGDGRPEVVISDKGNAAVMIYRNTSSPAGAPCFNASPTAKNDVATVRENAPPTTINVLANDTDPDGGPKLVASVTPPAHGTAAIGGGGVRYKPAAATATTSARRATPSPTSSTAARARRVAVTVECVDDAPPTGAGPRLAASAAAPATTAASAHLHHPRHDAVHRRHAG